MAAFRIFSRFAELLDIKVTRAAEVWLRLNADGTHSERTAAQTLTDLAALPGVVATVASNTTSSTTANVAGASVTLGAGTYLCFFAYQASDASGSQVVIRFVASAAVFSTALTTNMTCDASNTVRSTLNTNTTTVKMFTGAGSGSYQAHGFVVLRLTGSATVSMTVATNNGTGTATLLAGSGATFVKISS